VIDHEAVNDPRVENQELVDRRALLAFRWPSNVRLLRR
jgi:hypothetical protein